MAKKAKNVTTIPLDAQLTGLVTSREALLKQMEEDREAYKRYTLAEAQLGKNDGKIMSLLVEAKKLAFEILGYVLTVTGTAKAPAVTKIGINELQEELKKRELHVELDLVEDILEEMKAQKTKANAKKVEGVFDYSLEITEARQRAIG